jgi:hypothetical protein
MFRYFLACILLLMLVGCQGQRKKVIPSNVGSGGDRERLAYFEGRITVEDFLKKKNHAVNVEAFLVKNKKMRIEANGPLGIKVASVLVTENRIQAQLYLERKYLNGDFLNVWKYDAQTLRAISIPVSPKFLQSVFLQDRTLGPNWKCEKEALFEECLNLSKPKLSEGPNEKLPEQPQKMTWIKTDEGRIKFFAESSNYRLTWEPSADMQFIENNPKIFTLEVNEAFKKIEITPR